MRVLGISGSHRVGNTDFMINLFLSQLHKKGHNIKFVDLKTKNIGYSSVEDYGCKETSGCGCCRDDMKQMYKEMEQSDLIIFGSPTYFMNVSSRMKVFMDRFTPYWINRKLEGKKVVIMGVGASTVEIVGQMMERLEKFVECFGMKIIQRFVAVEEKQDGVEKNGKYVEEIKELVERIK